MYCLQTRQSLKNFLHVFSGTPPNLGHLESQKVPLDKHSDYYPTCNTTHLRAQNADATPDSVFDPSVKTLREPEQEKELRETLTNACEHNRNIFDKTFMYF